MKDQMISGTTPSTSLTRAVRHSIRRFRKWAILFPALLLGGALVGETLRFSFMGEAVAAAPHECSNRECDENTFKFWIIEIDGDDRCIAAAEGNNNVYCEWDDAAGENCHTESCNHPDHDDGEGD